jgi:hypothetical protein
MSNNPTILSVSPAAGVTDVVLGAPIVITFNKAIDTDSFNNATFVLTGPDLAEIVTVHQIIQQTPVPSYGNRYILGTFGFSTKTYSPWAPGQIYHVGDQVIDINGNAQTVSETGVSAPYAPAWLQTVGAVTTDNNLPAWQALANYPFGQYILDPNGNIQKCTTTVGGTSGTEPPQWNRTTSGITFDGGLTWTNYGPLNPVVWVNNGPAYSGGTVATFVPAKSLIPGETYTVLVVGSDSTVAATFVQDLSGNPLLNSQQWTFTTGTLTGATPPIQNPIPPPKSYLNFNQIQVIPRPPVGVDDPSVSNISQVELIFPAPVDPNSFDPSQLLIGVEPIMNDPDVMVLNTSASYIIQGNKIIVTITGT